MGVHLKFLPAHLCGICGRASNSLEKLQNCATHLRIHALLPSFVEGATYTSCSACGQREPACVAALRGRRACTRSWRALPGPVAQLADVRPDGEALSTVDGFTANSCESWVSWHTVAYPEAFDLLVITACQSFRGTRTVTRALSPKGAEGIAGPLHFFA